jgi:DNA-binding MarR family transcriptional regulator
MSRPVPFETTIEVRDTCFCLHVQRAARTLARRFDDAFRPIGLTNGQFSLLMSLNCPEPRAIGPVARLLGMDRTTVTAALKPLRERGLVEISADAGDRRSRLLELTAAGGKVLAAAVPIWRKTHEALEGELHGVEGDGLRAALQVLCGSPGGKA